MENVGMTTRSFVPPLSPRSVVSNDGAERGFSKMGNIAMENQNERPLKADELSAVTGGTYDPEPGDWQDYNRECPKCGYSPIWVHDCQSKFPLPLVDRVLVRWLRLSLE